MEYRNLIDHITQEFGGLTLRERSLIAQLFENNIQELEEYRKVLIKYREGSVKPKTRIIKGSQDNNYIVESYEDNKYYCSCSHFQYRLSKMGGVEYCKHIKEWLKNKR